MPSIQILCNDIFQALTGLNPQKPNRLVFRTKLFQLCLLIFTFPSCWKFAYIQPVPEKGDCFNPSNYLLIALACHYGFH
ncbi:hypothetical protein E2C01_050989 [Portunus trituberculatus]|uniref:Uncharacterized protein n=1 Tax=Portunus trituberculatus TaxID=210409 RepID=A0A5B7GAF1_PORTR|nr:hypothetical protein [Portunus trituberculatus]